MARAIVLGMVMLLASLAAADAAPATQPADFPGIPVRTGKVVRVELNDKLQPLPDTQTDDEIFDDNGAWNTRGLARLGLPGVKVHELVGNATNFYWGTAKPQGGGSITWNWHESIIAHQRIDHPTVTWAAPDGAPKKTWRITMPVPATQPAP